MDRKHRCHKRTAPKKPCHPPQYEEEQYRRRHVEEDIGEMMPAGMQPIKLAVQHVRNPGQRMPVGGVDMGKCPDDPLERQTPGNFRVFIYVKVVVVVDKLVTQCLAENHPNNRRQKNADPGDQPAVIQPGRRTFGFQKAAVSRFRHLTGTDGRNGRT